MKNKLSGLRNFTYGVVAFIGVVYIFKIGSFIFIPLTWAIFFSFALVPLTAWFENKRIPRLMAILFSLFLVTIIALLIIYLFISQVSSLLKDAPGIGDKLRAFLTQIDEAIQQRFGLQHVVNRDISSYFSEKNLSDVLNFTTSTVTTFTLMPAFIFLFLYYQDFFREFINRLALRGNIALFDWLKEAVIVVRKYLAGMLLVTLIVAVLASIMFYLLGIKYYMLFGLFTAICNLVPYIGVIIGSIITIIYVLITTDQLWYPLLTLVLLWLLQVVENNVITPVVVGAKIKLNPLAVILAIVTGGALWGISGMILFIPMLGTVKIFFDKTEHLKPYSYLLGDEIPIIEPKENLFFLLRRWFRKSHPVNEKPAS